MYCIHCGTKNPEDSKFCYRCGTAIVAPPASVTPNLPPPVSVPPTNYPYPPATPTNYPYPPSNYPTQTSAVPSNYPASPPSESSTNYPYPLPPTTRDNHYSPPAAPAHFNPSPPNAAPLTNTNGYVPVPAPAYPPLPYNNLPVGYPHPLLLGAVGLPSTIMTNPQDYYSYADPQGRVKLARRIGFWQRFAAMLIDFIIILIPVFVISTIYALSLSQSELLSISRRETTLNIPSWLSLVVDLLGLAYFYVLTLNGGQTLGKRAMRIKIIRLDGQKPDWITSALRQFLGYTLSTIPFLLGFIWAGWDAQKQAWHDKLARTLVVDSRVLEEGRDFFLPRN